MWIIASVFARWCIVYAVLCIVAHAFTGYVFGLVSLLVHQVLCMEDDEDDGYYYDKEQDRYLPKSERPTRSEEEKEKNQKKAD